MLFFDFSIVSKNEPKFLIQTSSLVQIKKLDRQIDRKVESQTDRKIDRQIERQKDRKIDRQTDRKLDRQIDRQIDRQNLIHFVTMIQ